MPAASCPTCGWQREYAHRQGASLGLRRHRDRDCGPALHGFAATGQGSEQATRRNQVHADLEGGRWRARTELAGYRPERTVEEWVAHPFALDDLLRVLAGTRLEKIAAERSLMRRSA